MFPLNEIIQDQSDWPFKLGNLSKLLQGLEAFYNNELGIVDTRIFSTVDCGKIAKMNHIPTLMVLLELIIGALVRCTAKEKYISRIMSLPERVQTELMGVIENSLNRIEANEPLDLKKEIQLLRQEKRTMSVNLEQMQNALREASVNYEAIVAEKNDLQAQIGALESDLKNNRKTTSSNDAVAIANQLESEIRAKDAKIRELQTQIIEQAKQFEKEKNDLKDDLDLHQDYYNQLVQTEKLIERYKKQVEDLTVDKRKLREVQEANEALKDKLAEVENSASGNESLKQNLQFYKERLTSEKERSANLTLELEAKNREIKELKKEVKELENKKELLRKDLKNAREETMRQSSDSSRFSEDSFTNKGGGLNLDLEEQLRKLEQENKVLKAQIGDKTLFEELNDQMDTAIISKKAAEDQLAQQLKKNKEIQRKLEATSKELEELRQEAANKEHELQTELATVNEHCTAYQKQLEILQNNLMELEKVKAESDSHVRDMKKLFKEKDQLTEKLFETKEEMHAIQNALAQAEATIKSQERNAQKLEDKLKETKESERIALNQLEVMKKTQNDMNEEMIDKIKYLELQRDMLKLEGDISGLKLALREKDDELVLVKNESAKNESSVREDYEMKLQDAQNKHTREMERSQDTLRQQEIEIQALKHYKEELNRSSCRELQIMSMVVHGVGMEMMRNNRSKNKNSQNNHS